MWGHGISGDGVAWRGSERSHGISGGGCLDEAQLALKNLDAVVRAVELLCRHSGDVGELLVEVLRQVRLEVLHHALGLVGRLLVPGGVAARGRGRLGNLDLQVFEVAEERLLFARFGVDHAFQVLMVLLSHLDVRLDGRVKTLDPLGEFLHDLAAALDGVGHLRLVRGQGAQQLGVDVRHHVRHRSHHQFRDLFVELGTEADVHLIAFGARIVLGLQGLLADL